MITSASRRQFLGASAALAGAALFDLPRLFAADEKDPYAGLPIGIQSYTLRKFSVLEAIGHMERLGVRYVEFFGAHFPLNSSDEKIADMKETLKKARLSIRAHGVNGFGSDHEANRKIFEFAKKCGFKTITADPRPDSFPSLNRLVAEYDIRIAIHNHGPGHRYDKLKDVASAISGQHELIGACVDTGHVLRSAEDPVKWIRELSKRCYALHIKDVAEQQARTHDVIIGKGHLDVVGVFKALKEIKFPADGSLSMEYESNPDNPVEDVRQCLAIAAEAIGKANA